MFEFSLFIHLFLVAYSQHLIHSTVVVTDQKRDTAAHLSGEAALRYTKAKFPPNIAEVCICFNIHLKVYLSQS